jgi:hypothetical protein
VEVPSKRRTVVLLTSALLLACDTEPDHTSAPPASASATTTTWHTLGAWSGRGGRQTESFDITSGALRVSWKTSSDAPDTRGAFRVELHSAISGRPLETVVDVEGVGADTVRVAASPRVAYLLIESDDVDWTITLEEGVATPPS